MSVEELLHYAFETGHPRPRQLGVTDDYSQGVLGGLGFYLQRAAFREQDVCERGLGGDGEVA